MYLLNNNKFKEAYHVFIVYNILALATKIVDLFCIKTKTRMK